MLRVVETDCGTVRGIPAADPRITAFKGIPFAAPATGKNRWRAPQPCEKWEGVLDCARFGAISVQDQPGVGTDIYCREWHVDPDIEMSEDSLTLNVWTPAKKADEKLPVLVWFYGGGLQWGYPPEMEFDGERLARRGIIVVSVNYRINVFGFLAHPELTKEAPDAPTNFGNLDQQAGLKWVQRNIEAFGGDKTNVTIAGQSAGGGSVMSQIACTANKGLFNKAVVMSAMIKSPFGGFEIGQPTPLAEAEQAGVEFFKYLGVETLDEARKLDASFILQKYGEFAQTHNRFFSVQDDKFCVGNPISLYRQGKCVDVIMMAGNTADEFPNVVPAKALAGFPGFAVPAKNDEELNDAAKRIFGDSAEEFLAFPEAHNFVEGLGYSPVNGIELTIKQSFEDVQALGNTNPCYYYRFDTDIPGWDNPGTFHSVDLWFFFETLAKCWRPFKGRHYDLARQMCNYWANFVKCGNPNGPDNDGIPMQEWVPYSKENPFAMIFSKEGPVSHREEPTEYQRFLMNKLSK